MDEPDAVSYIGFASTSGLKILMHTKPERFTQYLDSKHLPFNTVEIRNNSTNDIIFALAAHAPSPGVDYSPVNDLIISIVLQSNYGSVVRDVGFGRKNFKETPGCILVTPPMTASYWYFEGMPQILHICFPHDYLKKYLDDSEKVIPDIFGQLARDPIHDPLISMLASRLWTMSAASDKYAQICSDQILETILLTLFVESKGGAVFPSGNQRPSAGLAPCRLKHITELMERHMSEGISIDELAEIVGLSTHYFLGVYGFDRTNATSVAKSKAYRIREETTRRYRPVHYGNIHGPGVLLASSLFGTFSTDGGRYPKYLAQTVHFA